MVVVMNLAESGPAFVYKNFVLVFLKPSPKTDKRDKNSITNTKLGTPRAILPKKRDYQQKRQQ
jgi:hypothetical protein